MSFQDYVNSIRGTKNTEAVQSGSSGSFADYVQNIKINNFQSGLHTEQEHDAVMRATYGSYGQYVAQQLEKDTSLSDSAKANLISYYGLSDSDTIKKNNAVKQGATVTPSPQSDFQKLVKGVNDGTVKVAANISDDAYTQWGNSVADITKRVYEYLKTEGYKKPDTNLSKEIDSYLSKVADIGQYMRANKLRYEDYNTAYESYVNTVNNLKTLKQALDGSNAHYSKWSSKEEYDKSEKRKDPEYLKNLETVLGLYNDSYAVIKDTYDKWFIPKQGEIKEGETDYLTAGRYTYEDVQAAIKARNKWLSEATAKAFGGKSYTIEELKNAIQSIQEEYDYANYIQESNKILSVTNPDSEYYDPEIEKYAEIGKEHYQSTHTKNPSPPNINFDQKGYYSSNMEKMGEYKKKLYSFEYNNMTNEERQFYHYYLGKAVEEANGGEINEKIAEKYVKLITGTINARHGQKMARDFKDDKLAQLLFSAYAGIENFTTGVANNFNNSDYYIPPTATAVASKQVSEDMHNDGAGWGVSYDLINTISNMAPSIGLSYIPVIGKFLGVGAMGLSASGHAYADALNKGYSKKQARTYSALVGGSEAGLQYLLGGLSKLGGKFSLSTVISKIDNVFAKLALSGAAESLEEAIQAYLDPWFESIVTGVDFEAPDAEEVLYNSFIAFLSAGLLEGAPTAVSTVNDNISAKKLYGQTTEEMQALVDEGLEMPEDSKAYQLATKYQQTLKNSGKLSGSKLNKLSNANENAIIKQDVSKIKSAVEARLYGLGEKKNISKLADIITKQVSGEKLTLFEKNFLKESKYGNKVLEELTPESIVKSEYKNAWAESIGTDRINSTFYNTSEQQNGGMSDRTHSNVDEGKNGRYNDITNVNENNGGNINDSTNTELLAGGKVSAASRSGDGIRQQSENSRKLDDFLRDHEGSQKVHRQRTAGSSGWAHKSSDGTSRFEVGHRKGFLRGLREKPLNTVDSAGRGLSDSLINRLKDTALKDETGTILSFYHFTDVVFDIFKYGDIGFHFGTLDAAHNRHIDPARRKRGDAVIYKEVYIDVRNPVEIDGDRGVWDPFVTSYFLLDQGIFTDSEVNSLKNLDGYVRGRYDSEACVKLRDLLKKKGYDGIVYSNGIEGDISVIAFDADQIITVAENGVLKEGSGVSEDVADASADSIKMRDNGKVPSAFKEPNVYRSDDIITPVITGKPVMTKEHQYIIDIGEAFGQTVVFEDMIEYVQSNGGDIKNGIPEGYVDEGGTIHLGFTTSAPLRFVMKQVLKEFARYSPNFAAFEKVIKETDNLQKKFSGEISNQQDYVLEFAAEALFGENIGLRKLLAVAVSRDKKAAKFVPDFMKDMKKKLAKYPGIVEVLDEIQYTFSEAAYDARHGRADNSDDVFYDNYSKDESFWKADNKNKSNSSVTTLKDKLTALFGEKSNDGAAPSISEIVRLIEKTFGIPVSSGKFRHKAYGIYRQKPETIRTKVANALPTIAHELGHHLDKKHNLSQLLNIDEAIEVLKQQRPDFISSYAPRKHPNEAVAEFVRIYLADRAQAKAMYPKFFSEFEAALSKDGADELNNIKIIGDKINSYFTADKAERARAAILTRAEARKINRRGIRLSDVLEKLNIQLLDDGAALKKISDEAYNLYYFAKKSSVRAKNTISGYYMPGFDGDLVEMRDKNGSIIKDNDGKPQYVKSLKYVLEGIDTQEQMSDFDTYLACRHGIYWVENDLRVFADDSLNNKEYMQSEIERLEKQYPNFKETAENLYDWYRTFIYEYGIKSGLLTKEQFKSMTEKYPCYVPFMRNVDKLGSGVKAGAANQSAPIRNAKGSGLEILSPVENIIVKVEQFMKAADRNAIMQEVADVADTAEGKGYLLERVPPSMVPVTVSMKTEPGDIIDDAITETITEFRVNDNQGMNVVRVYRNGEKTYYQVHDKNLLAALTAMNTVKYNIVTRAAGNLTRVFKVLTTGGNAVWSISSNAPRDFSSAYKYSSENNPIKFTVDYIRAIKSAFTEAYLGDKHSDEAIKLYKSMGGGFNNSLSNSARELKLTIKEVLQKDENLVKRITANFNFIEMVEKLADSIETAPRLAEFKRVYEKTGDAKAALSAAEEITVNFNRSGVSGKVVDQFIPYFNASLQGNRKFAKALTESLRSGGDKSFVVKTLLSGVVKIGLIFAINNLIMGDDDNDEYEKLSAYKKNNFYNIYIGDGKFISIPKSKDTAVFDSMLERTFEMAMKEDVEWGKEIEDFLSYLWLVFGPPLLDDTIGFSTALELAKNETFTGAPIVSSYYEDLEPEMQYNEKTTYIARGLGQLFGWSPMKIDHVINSNLGVFGLLNKSVGTPDPDLSLGLMTKFVTDNTYSTDTMNSFYDRAEEYSSLSKSYPDDTDALYNDELYSSVRSIISELNRYGKEDEAAARDYRILANDYALNYTNEIAADGKLIALLENTHNADILPYKNFNADYSIDKVKYRMDSDTFMDYVEEYYSEISQEYRDILRMGYSDETTAAMLIDAKKDVDQYVSKKYKVAQ